jgi:hypothetical protein
VIDGEQFYLITSPIWVPILLLFIGGVLLSYDKKKLGKSVMLFGVLYAIIGFGMCTGII